MVSVQYGMIPAVWNDSAAPWEEATTSVKAGGFRLEERPFRVCWSAGQVLSDQYGCCGWLGSLVAAGGGPRLGR